MPELNFIDSTGFTVSGVEIATLAFFITILFFTIFTIVLVYHWFSYGNSRALSMLSLAVFLLASAPVLLTMAVSLRFM